MFIHKGVTITINSSGRFSARLLDVEVDSDTLAGIKQKIDSELAVTKKRALSLPVVGVVTKVRRASGENADAKLGRANITGVNRSSRQLQFSGLPEGHEIAKILPDSPRNAAIVKRWMDADAEYAAINSLYLANRIAVAGYGRIDMAEYDAIIDQVTASYERAKDAGK